MFSIIIPLYNKEKYIYNTIQSVLGQTYEDFEIIVVNDSSTDNSLLALQGIRDVRLQIYTKPNEGVSAARNYGIKKAKHDYIAFLDADDLWESNYLATVASVIKKYPDCGMIHSAYKRFVKDINNIVNYRDALTICSDKAFVVKDYFYASYQYKTVLGQTSATCVKKQILDLFDNPFPKNIQCGEDADLWLRVACITKVVYINEHNMLYRVEAENSLYQNYKRQVNGNMDYTEWYSLNTNSKSKYLFVNLFVGRYALSLAKLGEKKEAKKCLSFMHGQMDLKTVIRYTLTKIRLLIL